MEVNRCEQCRESFEDKGDYCSDRCFCYAFRHALPLSKASLRAWDGDMIQIIPKGQQKVFELNRPQGHALVCGGKKADWGRA